MSETQIPSPQEIPDDFVRDEITRATESLNAVLERGRMGGEGYLVLGERVLRISQLVQGSPDRLAVDMPKPPANRTEYDAERAHLMALATDGNRTALAAARGRRFSLPLPGQRARYQRNLLGARLGENLAGEVYDEDPPEAGPNMVEDRRLRSITADGGEAYKRIKPAKQPRR